jgi:hypothetical protein
MLDFVGEVGQAELMAPSLAVIILNYKRPQNIGTITCAAREALPEAMIFVFDQADVDTLRDRTDVDWSDVWLQRAKVNRGAGARVPLAARLPFDQYIAIDDDTFLTPAQIARLAEHLRDEPDRAHGICGERLELNEGLIRFRTSMARIDAPLSNLNQVYAFSRSQAAAAIDLSARIGFTSWQDLGVGNDILLSCASAKPPLCHDLGAIEECPTNNQPGIAVWRSDGFRERRAELARNLVAAGAIAVFSPLAYRQE